VLLSAYETTYPKPLSSKRPLPDPFAVALVLMPAPAPNARGRLTARICSATAVPDRLSHPQLEALRRAMPAARSLPLLRLLARREAGEVVLDYIGGQFVAVELSECR
jgi:hypothetical protein